MRTIAVAVHKLIFRDGRLDCPTIYVVVAMAIVLIADIVAYVFGPSVYGGNSVSDFGPNWTAWFPFGTFLVFTPALVFCETRKHLILMIAVSAVLVMLAIANIAFYMMRFWDSFGGI